MPSVRAELLSERRGKKCEMLSAAARRQTRACSKWRWITRARVSRRAATTKKPANRCSTICASSSTCATRPKRMECYDISNLQGSMVVGSQVTFDEGEPQKNLYRRYRIRSFEGQDDFAAHVRSSQAPARTRRARERVSRPVGDRRRQGSAERRARSAARIQAARSDRLCLSRQAARARRPPRQRGLQIRGARLPPAIAKTRSCCRKIRPRCSCW